MSSSRHFKGGYASVPAAIGTLAMHANQAFKAGACIAKKVIQRALNHFPLFRLSTSCKRMWALAMRCLTLFVRLAVQSRYVLHITGSTALLRPS